MNITPLYDHVLVSPAKEKTTEGVVVAVGDGIPLDNGNIRPLIVKPGNHVLFTSGSEVKINGEEYVVLLEQNIICILGQEPD